MGQVELVPEKHALGLVCQLVTQELEVASTLALLLQGIVKIAVVQHIDAGVRTSRDRAVQQELLVNASHERRLEVGGNEPRHVGEDLAGSAGNAEIPDRDVAGPVGCEAAKSSSRWRTVSWARASSASSTRIQSPAAIFSEALRAAAKSLRQLILAIRHPCRSAIPMVRSVDPASRTQISSTTPSRTAGPLSGSPSCAGWWSERSWRGPCGTAMVRWSGCCWFQARWRRSPRSCRPMGGDHEYWMGRMG